MTTETIDLITEKPDGTFVMILVEEGPWSGDAEGHLRRIQERLFNYVDIAVDGHLASLHPESRGRTVLIRVDAYGTPDGEVSAFVEQFASHVGTSAEVREAISDRGFVRAIDFECSEKELDEG